MSVINFFVSPDYLLIVKGEFQKPLLVLNYYTQSFSTPQQYHIHREQQVAIRRVDNCILTACERKRRTVKGH